MARGLLVFRTRGAVLPRPDPPAPAADREPELGHQPVGERRADVVPGAAPAVGAAAVVTQPGQEHRLGTTPYLDSRAGRQVDHAAAVTPPHGSCRRRPAPR